MTDQHDVRHDSVRRQAPEARYSRVASGLKPRDPSVHAELAMEHRSHVGRCIYGL